jgi:hypothetical protein
MMLMQTIRINASMTAYSTAVGPSGLARNRVTKRSARDMFFDTSQEKRVRDRRVSRIHFSYFILKLEVTDGLQKHLPVVSTKHGACRERETRHRAHTRTGIEPASVRDFDAWATTERKHELNWGAN